MKKAAQRKKPRLGSASDEDLLALRLQQLPCRLEGSQVNRLVKRLYKELKDRGLNFAPHVWLSDEWFCPDGVPGFAIPFYLAHPRLMKLEQKQMLEVEGGSEAECMRILRHEAGHAIDNAFRLHFRRDWQRVFGSFAKRYPRSYRPKPTSRKYVHHLNSWYAQSHPAEDFAETFAVWLTPRSRWRMQYEDWPALKKLEFVDALMQDLKGKRPRVRKRVQVDPLRKIKKTVAKHYRDKKRTYGLTGQRSFDPDLKRMFSSQRQHAHRHTAASFIRARRRELVELVARGTGTYHYTVDQVIRQMIERCKELKLRLTTDERRARQDVIILLTVATMNIILSGKNRIAL